MIVFDVLSKALGLVWCLHIERISLGILFALAITMPECQMQMIRIKNARVSFLNSCINDQLFGAPKGADKA